MILHHLAHHRRWEIEYHAFIYTDINPSGDLHDDLRCLQLQGYIWNKPLYWDTHILNVSNFRHFMGVITISLPLFNSALKLDLRPGLLFCMRVTHHECPPPVQPTETWEIPSRKVGNQSWFSTRQKAFLGPQKYMKIDISYMRKLCTAFALYLFSWWYGLLLCYLEPPFAFHLLCSATLILSPVLQNTQYSYVNFFVGRGWQNTMYCFIKFISCFGLFGFFLSLPFSPLLLILNLDCKFSYH